MTLHENIQVAFELFRRDARRLLTNPWALIIVIGVCFMPSLYAWTTILANWNPYGNSGALKVAITNEDLGATNNLTGPINVGNEVVAKLKQNHQLGWQFVSEDEALQGVEAGSYFAAIVIPKGFSQDFLSVLSGTLVRPQLDYYVNEKVSAVAPEFTTTGATTIEDQINETFVQAVSKTVVELAQTTGNEVREGAESADNSLTQGVSSALDVIASARQSITDMASGYEGAQTSITATKDNLATTENAIPGLTTTIDEAKAQLQSLRDGLRDFGTQVNGSLATASLELGSAAGAAAGAAAKAQSIASAAQSAVAGALATARYLAQENETILGDLKTQAQTNNLPAVQDALGRLEGQNTGLTSAIETLQSLNDSLATTASDLEGATAGADATAQSATSQTQTAASTLQQDTLPALTQSLDSFADALGTLHGTCVALEPALKNTISALDLLSVTLEQASAATSAADASLATIGEDLSEALTNLQTLSSSATMERLTTYLGLDPQAVGSFMASPVELKTVVEYPVKNYGSGVAPFYTNLALWVSGFILTAVLRVQVDEEDLNEPLTTTQAYLGRWLLFMVLALIQGLIVCVGDLALGIQCVEPFAFIAAGLVTVFVDVNILYALVFTMRHVGRALGVVLIIMQIPGSSGEYPVEMMPQFFQAIHPFLPFTYSIDAMREAIGGFYGNHYVMSLLGLLPFVGLALLVGLVAGRYAYNLNALFDSELSQSDLYIAEEPTADHEHFRLRHVLQALLDSQAYRALTLERIRRFDQRYPWLLRIGWIAIGALPALTLALAFASQAQINVKIILLALMVAGIVLVAIYLIVVEFAERSLQNQLALSRLDTTQVRQSLVGASSAQASGSKLLPSAMITSDIAQNVQVTSDMGRFQTSPLANASLTAPLASAPQDTNPTRALTSFERAAAGKRSRQGAGAKAGLLALASRLGLSRYKSRAKRRHPARALASNSSLDGATRSTHKITPLSDTNQNTVVASQTSVLFDGTSTVKEPPPALPLRSSTRRSAQRRAAHKTPRTSRALSPRRPRAAGSGSGAHTPKHAASPSPGARSSKGAPKRFGARSSKKGSSHG